MSSGNAKRQALWRRRQRDGRIVILVDADEVALGEFLERCEMLPRRADHTREDLGDGLSRLIALWSLLETEAFRADAIVGGGQLVFSIKNNREMSPRQPNSNSRRLLLGLGASGGLQADAETA
jgi:hypothetical protein